MTGVNYSNYIGPVGVQFPEILVYMNTYINPTSLQFLTIHHSSHVYAAIGATVYGGMNETDFTQLGSDTWTADNGGLHTVTCDTQIFYKYLKIRLHASKFNGYQAGVFDIYINGTNKDIPPMYENAWAAHVPSAYFIKY